MDEDTKPKNPMVPRYSFGICGSTGSDPRYNPGTVLREPMAQAIVRVLNAGSRPTPALAAAATELAAEIATQTVSPNTQTHDGNEVADGDNDPADFAVALVRVKDLRAICQHDGDWHIDFPLLTAADQANLAANLDPFAADLAATVMAAAPRIDALLTKAAWTRPLPEIRLAAVGCFGLDWAGLALLAKSNLIHHGHDYPDGGRFTIMGGERSAATRPDKLYCSSHTGHGEQYCFTGFGDNAGPRLGLPDLLWRLGLAQKLDRTPLSPPLARGLATLVRAQTPAWLDAAGQLCAGETPPSSNTNPPAIGELLSSLGYWSPDGGSNLQLYRASHWPVLQPTLAQLSQLMDNWLKDNYDGILAAAADTSPARNGIDPAMFFVDLWHDVFGRANQALAEGGWLHDPQPPTTGEARYLTWCAEKELYSLMQAASV